MLLKPHRAAPAAPLPDWQLKPSLVQFMELGSTGCCGSDRTNAERFLCRGAVGSLPDICNPQLRRRWPGSAAAVVPAAGKFYLLCFPLAEVETGVGFKCLRSET